jgi:ubiquinone biosynthesis accessory factor UbiJ
MSIDDTGSMRGSPPRADFILLNQTVTAAINHLLEGESWAQEKLRGHAGKSALIRVGPIDVCLRATAAGAVEGVTAGVSPDLEVKLAPDSLMAAVRGEDSVLKSSEIHGDADFAADVMFLVKNLRWDVEEDMSKLIGDIAAHRLVAEAQKFVAWERDARGRLAASLGEYLTDEGEILAAPAAVGQFVADVDRLRDDTARLEKRLHRLAKP